MGEWFLSRSDTMIVARHEVYRSPDSLQYTYFTLLGLKFHHSNHQIGAHTCTNQTVPYGTALLGWRCSRHFVPGYDRSVPPGHTGTAAAVRRRNVQTPDPGTSCLANMVLSLWDKKHRRGTPPIVLVLVLVLD
jgi:hypothetical protein